MNRKQLTTEIAEVRRKLFVIARECPGTLRATIRQLRGKRRKTFCTLYKEMKRLERLLGDPVKCIERVTAKLEAHRNAGRITGPQFHRRFMQAYNAISQRISNEWAT